MSFITNICNRAKDLVSSERVMQGKEAALQATKKTLLFAKIGMIVGIALAALAFLNVSAVVAVSLVLTGTVVAIVSFAIHSIAKKALNAQLLADDLHKVVTNQAPASSLLKDISVFSILSKVL